MGLSLPPPGVQRTAFDHRELALAPKLFALSWPAPRLPRIARWATKYGKNIFSDAPLRVRVSLANPRGSRPRIRTLTSPFAVHLDQRRMADGSVGVLPSVSKPLFGTRRVRGRHLSNHHPLGHPSIHTSPVKAWQSPRLVSSFAHAQTRILDRRGERGRHRGTRLVL